MILSGGFGNKGISGGERKRVSVGHELLINPSLILLDEPTSGLDATTAMHLLTCLRQLASGGRAVITTIHQCALPPPPSLRGCLIYAHDLKCWSVELLAS